MGSVNKNTKVSILEILIITVSIPTINTTEDKRDEIVCCKFLPRVSTSLVILDNRSPVLFLSKKAVGIYFTFSDISLLILSIKSCVISTRILPLKNSKAP